VVNKPESHRDTEQNFRPSMMNHWSDRFPLCSEW
jgi:hypothetical protein